MPQAILHNTLFQPKVIDESGARVVLPEGPVDFFRAIGFPDLEPVAENERASQLRFEALARSGGEPVAWLAEWSGLPEDEFPRNGFSGREQAIGRALEQGVPWLLLGSKLKLELFSLAAADPEACCLVLDRRQISRAAASLGASHAEPGGPWELGLLPAAKPQSPAGLEPLLELSAGAERVLVSGEFLSSEIRPLVCRLRKNALKNSIHPLLVVARREFPDRFDEACLPVSAARPRERIGQVRLLAGEPGLHAFVTELSRDPSAPRPRALLNQQMSFLEILFAEQLQLLGTDLTLLSLGPTSTNRGAKRRLELGLTRFKDVANLWLAVRLGARLRPGAIANIIDALDGDSDDFLARLKTVQPHIDRLLKKHPVAHVELEVPEVYVQDGRPRHDPGFHLIAAGLTQRKAAQQALVRLAGVTQDADNPTDEDLLLAVLDRHDSMLSSGGVIAVRTKTPSTNVAEKARSLFSLSLRPGGPDGWVLFERSR